MIIALAILYLILGLLLTLYTAGSALLLIIALATRNQRIATAALSHYPHVTVQLPIYNERYVVDRLLHAVAHLDYPRNCLVIQLLDDSDDATTRIAARKVVQLRQQGFNVQHIRRRVRTGYKAGALAYGMEQSKTPFYAIFDADFLPPANFLQRTLPHLLANPQLGMVQGRWGHLNPNENALTAAEALAIDGHFAIEQTARSQGKLLLNFNGTGGVWRRTCIQDAGGWQATTLTEDLDLSYRAQFNGWQLQMLPDLVIPGELPPQLMAFKQQQFRWAKGSTQCLTLMLPQVWGSPQVSFLQRIMGTLHLCQYMPYPILLLLSLFAPILMLAGTFDALPLGFLLFSGVVPPLMYAFSQWILYSNWQRKMLAFPALIVFGTGIALNNTVAIMSAWLGNTGEFRRTPKFGQDWMNSSYALREDIAIYGELLLTLYMGWGTWVAANHAIYATPYLALSTIAYGVFSLWGFRERWQIQQAKMQPINE